MSVFIVVEKLNKNVIDNSEYWNIHTESVLTHSCLNTKMEQGKKHIKSKSRKRKSEWSERHKRYQKKKIVSFFRIKNNATYKSICAKSFVWVAENSAYSPRKLCNVNPEKRNWSRFANRQSETIQRANSVLFRLIIYLKSNNNKQYMSSDRLDAGRDSFQRFWNSSGKIKYEKRTEKAGSEISARQALMRYRKLKF